MSAENFKTCLEWLLEHEGGFVNDPRDSGGMTNLGVTKMVYDAYYGKNASEEDMRALTVEDVEPIYLERYWNKSSCPLLPSGVDWAVFDWAVNSGPSRAVKALQQSVKTAKDGIIGPQTLRKIAMENPRDIIEDMWIQREQFYRSLSNFDSFGKGWLRRNNETRILALCLLEE